VLKITGRGEVCKLYYKVNNMKRFDCEAFTNFEPENATMREREDGDYVLYDDIKDLETDLKEARELYKEAREKIEQLEKEVIGYKESCFNAVKKLDRYETALKQYADLDNNWRLSERENFIYEWKGRGILPTKIAQEALKE